MLVSDGVEQEEYDLLYRSFSAEGAEIHTVSPLPFPWVESVSRGKRGRDIPVTSAWLRQSRAVTVLSSSQAGPSLR